VPNHDAAIKKWLESNKDALAELTEILSATTSAHERGESILRDLKDRDRITLGKMKIPRRGPGPVKPPIVIRVEVGKTPSGYGGMISAEF
jgi:hypothetical protein